MEVVMAMRKPSLFCGVLFLMLPGLFPCISRADDRILVNASINGRPVSLAFDTGAGFTVLFRNSADRLRLKTSSMDVTEKCTFKFGEMSQKAVFDVIEAPFFMSMNIDGFIGWTAATNHVFELDVERNVCRISDNVPQDLRGWTKWNLVTNAPVVIFECSNDVGSAKIGIDTGFPGGVMLSPQRWQLWRTERAGQPATVENGWTPGEDLVNCEMLRARRIVLGAFILADVPVSEATPKFDTAFQHSDAIVGLYALRQMKLIIDARNGVLYTCPIAHPSGQYAYNRLGADFMPKDPDKGEDFAAFVIPGSPAYRAGIRNGDLLLKIGKYDLATLWRHPRHLGGKPGFFQGDAGTKLKLTLKRNNQEYETTVMLHEVPAVD